MQWGTTLHPANFWNSKITDICLDTEVGNHNQQNDILLFGVFVKQLLTKNPEMDNTVRAGYL